MNDHAKPHDVNGTPDPEDPGDGPGNGSRFGIRRPRTRAEERIAALDETPSASAAELDAARARFAALSGEVTAAAVALGITSTPTAVVNGVVLPSADWETLVAAIDAVLAAADGAAPSPSPAG